ncbi:transcriptional regulator ATRX-like [Trichoplusia ni]|uniref:Transcriptional regulator ATRX-like n=1 Tax=Trichoplusia ni TaxID=7111 RepID=A0A7E5VNQ7_TRINI|nr:transcriptional regulator ATRX-like [Trichoplusia ni]
MHMTKVPRLLLVLLCSELCAAIKVPVTWNDSVKSEVKNEQNVESPVEIFNPQNVQTRSHNQQPIPIEYFEYTAQKPKFATEIAAFHGVKNPEQNYKAYPVQPYTGKQKPVLGVHHLLDEERPIYHPLQTYIHQNKVLNRYVHPTSSGYEIFHPYKAEEPALQTIYRDPVLSKIRNDIQDSKNRLQAYEQAAGEPHISADEYLESPEKTDRKLFPQKNEPAPYEIHRPERVPAYYRAPTRDLHRDHALNQKFRHPWNQQNVKIRPVHYLPLHKHIGKLRNKHAMKYDDEHNEYPQVPVSENIEKLPEGYDIYEKGKQKYTQLRNNLDESVNNIVQKHHPANYKTLELQNNSDHKNEQIDEEFIPVKNYAQVRKTETYKHLPKTAAFDDAETYEEILNAPRLREAVKSTKAQTVYSEEGYEDSAYDHAGEQKHASDQEGHGGFLKEHENSGGLYKIPSVAGKYQDGAGSEYRDNTEHGKAWNSNDKDEEEETEAEDYSEIEHDESVETDAYNGDDAEIGNRNKREGEAETEIETNNEDNNDDSSELNPTAHDNESNDPDTEHEVGKREVNFKVPEIDLNSTFIIKSPTTKHHEKKNAPLRKKESLKNKYPYYFKNLKGVHKNSPLRYAENLKLIPKKSRGGTEFYDSRSKLQCSEVDEDVDPLPEKLKNGENPTNEDEDDDEESKAKSFDTVKQVPRLEGLGDKIDCFKAKYFGENPLDSPFFKEDIISNPEPIFAPKLSTFQLKNTKGDTAEESKVNKVISAADIFREDAKTNIFDLLDKLRIDQNNLHENLNKSSLKLHTALNIIPFNNVQSNKTEHSDVYTDVLKNIQNSQDKSEDIATVLLNSEVVKSNVTYDSFQKREDITKKPPQLRKKRAAPFVYEPYKIIRDGQVQDSKKTTTTSNISPLIKQLQSSGVADRVSRSNKDDKLPKKSLNSRTYVDIGRKARAKPQVYNGSDHTFVDVSIDQRRGEPRYELRPSNHKAEYTPVENKRAMSVVAYNAQKTTEKNIITTKPTPIRGRQRFRSTTTTVRPVYDVAQFIPKPLQVQNVAASNSVKKTVTTAPASVQEKERKQDEDSEEVEDSEEYDDDDDEEEEDDEEEVPTTTTTTTLKPSFRKRIKFTTTTEKVPEHNTESEAQLLKLVTRFRNYKPTDESEPKDKVKPAPEVKKNVEESDIALPKYREKKKKSHTSTIVTDSNKYGNEDEDEDMEKTVDDLIGVKHDMKDYMPMYEKEESKKNKHHQSRNEENNDSREEEEEDSENEDENDDDDDDHPENSEEEESGEDDEEEDGEDDNDDKKDDDNTEPEIQATTPEPTKRTLIRTTDAPPTTKATFVHTTIPSMPSRIIKPEGRPVITRKKIEIHKELPVNKSSPHITQFKQDIKQVEIIKEIPTTSRKKPQKNAEVLNLYKDDNLAQEINKLGDVEIFRENLNLNEGPKHGGNYRKATKEELRLLKPRENTAKRAKDAETSQSETNKNVELEEFVPKRLHGGNLKALSDTKRSRSSDRNSKLIELNDPPVRMHGGNLKYDKDRRGGRRSEKLIELDDEEDDHSSQDDKEYKPLNTRHERMHGGNYRSAKIVAPQEDDDIQVKSSKKESPRNAALLLAQFAQAAPILTSTPAYILDPSKRMYYYVDA